MTLLKKVSIGLIVVALIAAGLLVWAKLSEPAHTATATILILAIVAAGVLQFVGADGLPDAAACEGYKACVAWLLALGGGALVLFVMGWVVVKFTGADASSSPVGLSLIVLVGVIALLIVISLVTFTYSVLGLANPAEALGLPDGSVRSIIALMLLVLFSIVSLYLFNSVKGLDATKDAGAIDLAKQLVTLLGTLVTAVASFYFGANAVSSAHKDASGRSEPPPEH